MRKYTHKTRPKHVDVSKYAERIKQLFDEGLSASKIAKTIRSSLAQTECISGFKVSNFMKSVGLQRTHSETLKLVKRERACVCRSCQKPFIGSTYNDAYCKICAPTLTDHLRINHYSLAKPEFDKILEKQCDACAICKIKFADIQPHPNKSSSAVVDHNHKTGEVRGLLCSKCNIALGHIEKKGDEWLSAALSYAGQRNV